MLPKASRLRASRDFTLALRRGRRASARGLVAHLAVLPGDAAPPRVGLVTPRAVGPAVARNRVRRELRHLMRPRLARLPRGARLVVRVLPGATPSGAELASELDLLLDRVSTERPARR